MDADFLYFKDNMTDFYKKYGSRYIAIKNESVLGVYDTFHVALEETLINEKLGTFIVQQCTDNAVNFTYAFQANICLGQ